MDRSRIVRGISAAVSLVVLGACAQAEDPVKKALEMENLRRTTEANIQNAATLTNAAAIFVVLVGIGLLLLLGAHAYRHFTKFEVNYADSDGLMPLVSRQVKAGRLVHNPNTGLNVLITKDGATQFAVDTTPGQLALLSGAQRVQVAGKIARHPIRSSAVRQIMEPAAEPISITAPQAEQRWVDLLEAPSGGQEA